MKIGIHPLPGSFSDRWIPYCKSNNIPFKIVDCYRSDIVEQLADCDALMWHFSHMCPKSTLFAKQLLYALQHSRKIVFPDFITVWHFDDKVGQKYLLESLNLPLVNSYVFYTKDEALQWASTTQYPKVFKLRGGAGSVNVRLIRTKQKAGKIIKRAFGKGFKHDSIVPFSEIWKKYQVGIVSFSSLVKSFARFFIRTEFAKVHNRERGYVYFQDFIPGNDFDIRVIVIGDKAFAIKRMVRDNDFRASGSGKIFYTKELFDKNIIQLAFQLANKLMTQCIAFDFVYEVLNPKLVEISYGFSPAGYDPCPGYWDSNLTWHEGNFDPYGWMVEEVLEKLVR